MRAKPVLFWHQGEITKYFLILRIITNNSDKNYFKLQRSWANRGTKTKASKDSGPTRGRNSAENQTENGPHQSQPAKESAGPYTQSTENTFPRYFSYTTIFFFIFNTFLRVPIRFLFVYIFIDLVQKTRFLIRRVRYIFWVKKRCEIFSDFYKKYVVSIHGTQFYGWHKHWHKLQNTIW